MLELTTPKYLTSLVVEASPQGIFRAACQVGEEINHVSGPAAIDEDIFGGILHATKRYPEGGDPTRGTVGSQSKSVPNVVQQYLHDSGLLDGGRLRLRSLVLPDRFVDHGDQGQLLAEVGLDAASILKRIDQTYRPNS